MSTHPDMAKAGPNEARHPARNAVILLMAVAGVLGSLLVADQLTDIIRPKPLAYDTQLVVLHGTVSVGGDQPFILRLDHPIDVDSRGPGSVGPPLRDVDHVALSGRMALPVTGKPLLLDISGTLHYDGTPGAPMVLRVTPVQPSA
ncbi:hypothetical protein KPL74_05050 [Bacillus sp. NP157]|nr:hypothetical protein KPL74_05050 [Bacillus sp. NP157]